MNTPNRRELSGLPTWRGVEGTRYIWHGCWSDPEIYYDGYLFNYWDVEDALSEEDKEDPDLLEGVLYDLRWAGCGEKYEEGNGTYTMEMEFRKLFES